MKHKDIALVLSGGGARGIMHIGVIEELLERGYNITSIAGTSMGSIVGGVYAMGKLDILKKFLLNLDKKTAVTLIDFSMGAQGLIKGDKIVATLKKLMGEMNIEDLDIPYVAIATNITTGKEVEFKSGDIYAAMRASMSIPSVFIPVKTEEGLLVDGGVLNNIPVNNIHRKRRDKIIAVNVNADIPLLKLDISQEEQKEEDQTHRSKLSAFYNHFKKSSPPSHNEKMSYVRLIEETISLVVNKMAEYKMEIDKPDLLIKISKDSGHIFDFFKAEKLINIGRAAAKEQLDHLDKRSLKHDI